MLSSMLAMLGKGSFMASLESHVEALIAELTRVQAPGTALKPDEKGFWIPGQIAAGNGRFIMTTRETERLIELASRKLQSSHPILSHSHTDKEWSSIVRSAFGPALMLIDFDDDRQENARTVVAAIREAVFRPVKAHSPDEHAIGCALFGNFEVSSFSIGLVQFEPRPAWLARKLSEGDVRKTTAQRIMRVWSGGKPRKRKDRCILFKRGIFSMQ
jgi:hypothetical protein